MKEECQSQSQAGDREESLSNQKISKFIEKTFAILKVFSLVRDNLFHLNRQARYSR